METPMPTIDPLFERLNLVWKCLYEHEKDGVRILSHVDKPAWLPGLLRTVHRGGPPDEYTLQAIYTLAVQFSNACHQLKSVLCSDGVDLDELYKDCVATAEENFVRYCVGTESDKRRWLMWQGGRHWEFIDEALTSETTPSFDDLLELGAACQLDDVCNRIGEFFFELDEVTPTDETVTPETDTHET